MIAGTTHSSNTPPADRGALADGEDGSDGRGAYFASRPGLDVGTVGQEWVSDVQNRISWTAARAISVPQHRLDT